MEYDSEKAERKRSGMNEYGRWRSHPACDRKSRLLYAWPIVHGRQYTSFPAPAAQSCACRVYIPNERQKVFFEVIVYIAL